MMKKAFDESLFVSESHVNGWPVIQYFLNQRQKTQSALAGHLQITPSAVTQIKHGQFLLNAGQLRKITDFLEMDPAGMSALYAQVFRGRLLAKNDRETHGIALQIRLSDTTSPDQAICQVKLLEDYEPAVESPGRFLARHGFPDTGQCHIRWQPHTAPAGWTGGGELFLRYNEYPRPGDIVLLKIRGVSCRITRFLHWQKTGGVFTDLAPGAVEKKIPFAGIAWLYPAEIPRVTP